MTEQALTVEDDLAYLRRVVDSDRGARVRFKFGVVYLICGLLWGPYALIVWAVNTGLLKWWIALVAIGWYLAALITGFNMRMPDFVLCMGISMLVLMALPGWIMIRRNPAAAA